MAAKQGSEAPFISKEYQISLRNFWAGRPRTAIEHLSKLLADDPDRDDQFFLYRLWIEILADLREFDSLRTLNQHLWARSIALPKFYLTYAALRGLIYYELDCLGAAKMYAEAVKTETRNPYCLELIYLVKQRAKPRPITHPLSKWGSKLMDYFHLQSVVCAQMQAKKEKQVSSHLKYLLQLYPESPLPGLYAMHRNIDKRNFKDARSSAHKLWQRFSSKVDFAVFAAYASIKAGDSNLATDILEKTYLLGGEDDVDTNSLLGACYTDLYQNSQDEVFKEKGMHFLKKATAMLEDMGFSAAVPSYHEHLLAHEDGDADEFGDETRSSEQDKNAAGGEDKQAWLVKLKPNMFFAIRTQDENDLCFMTLPMAEGAKPGDIVLLAGDDYRKGTGKDKTWRLAAVFSVASVAKWHPYNGFETCLQLISKTKNSIPLPVHMLDKPIKLAENPGKQQNIDAVFQLDEEAVDTLTSTILQYNDESESDRLRQEFSVLSRSS